MYNKIKRIGSGVIAFSIIFSASVMAESSGSGAFGQFVGNIGSTSKGVGQLISYVAYTIAGILFFIAGWNMYKKSKNPNGNEGSIILGAILAGSVLLAIPTIAQISEDGLFGGADSSENVRFGQQ